MPKEKGVLNMLSLMTVVYGFENRYRETNQTKMDEMKMHKLLYFAQRESYAVYDEPLFDEDFHGWRYGPVLHEVRNYYSHDCIDPFTNAKQQELLLNNENDDKKKYTGLLKSVFDEYSSIDSWSLSLLSQKECSWKQSRKGLRESEHGDKVISKKDIRKDAFLVRLSQNKKLDNERKP